MLAWVFDDNVPSSRREMHALHLQRATVLRGVRLEQLQDVVAGVVLSRNHVLFVRLICLRGKPRMMPRCVGAPLSQRETKPIVSGVRSSLWLLS